jgi:hypothetical protein
VSHRVDLQAVTQVSKDRSAYTIKISNLGFLTLKVKDLRSSETSVTIVPSTRRNIPQYFNLQYNDCWVLECRNFNFIRQRFLPSLHINQRYRGRVNHSVVNWTTKKNSVHYAELQGNWLGHDFTWYFNIDPKSVQNTLLTGYCWYQIKYFTHGIAQDIQLNEEFRVCINSSCRVMLVTRVISGVANKFLKLSDMFDTWQMNYENVFLCSSSCKFPILRLIISVILNYAWTLR